MTKKGLSLEMKVGERLLLDSGRIAIILEQKTGQRARIRVEAEPTVKIGSPRPNGTSDRGATR